MDQSFQIKDNILLFQRGFLSNWYGAFLGQSSPITALIHTCPIDGEYFTFNCAEQLLMARKAELFEDYDTVNKILQEKHPRKQQLLGREVKNFDDKIWELARRSMIREMIELKFTQNDHLRKCLTSISKWCIIGEATDDLIYGTGVPIDCHDAFDTSKWIGRNLLGLELMKFNYER